MRFNTFVAFFVVNVKLWWIDGSVLFFSFGAQFSNGTAIVKKCTLRKKAVETLFTPKLQAVRKNGLKVHLGHVLIHFC